MTGPAKVIVTTAEELTALIESAVSNVLRNACLPVKTGGAPTVPAFFAEHELVKQYRIGRRELRTLILTGKLPSTTRRIRGGRESFFVRSDDADRVLGSSSSN